MATFTGLGRTNYFRVRDTGRLEELLSGSGITVEHEAVGDRVVLLDAEGSDWTIYSDDDDYEGTWLPDVIAEHLAPGETAIFQSIGNEKLRFLSGYAVAVSASGEQVQIALDDIYDQAAARFGVPADTISRAIY